jgi:hypothetical protein
MIQINSVRLTVVPASGPRRVDAGQGRVVRVVKPVVSIELAAAEIGNASSLIEVRAPLGAPAAPEHGRMIGDWTRAGAACESTSLVTRNGYGLEPPSTFYRQRYSRGQVTPAPAEARMPEDEGAATWEDAEWR